MLDFLLDETGDLAIENGDLVVGNAENQNKALLLKLPKGAIKEKPTATVGLSNYLEGENPGEMLREIRTRFSEDGMEVKELGVSGTKINIDADYK